MGIDLMERKDLEERVKNLRAGSRSRSWKSLPSILTALIGASGMLAATSSGGAPASRAIPERTTPALRSAGDTDEAVEGAVRTAGSIQVGGTETVAGIMERTRNAPPS